MSERFALDASAVLASTRTKNRAGKSCMAALPGALLSTVNLAEVITKLVRSWDCGAARAQALVAGPQGGAGRAGRDHGGSGWCLTVGDTLRRPVSRGPLLPRPGQASWCGSTDHRSRMGFRSQHSRRDDPQHPPALVRLATRDRLAGCVLAAPALAVLLAGHPLPGAVHAGDQHLRLHPPEPAPRQLRRSRPLSGSPCHAGVPPRAAGHDRLRRWPSSCSSS